MQELDSAVGIFCPHCQGAIGSADIYCGNCGKQIAARGEEENTDVFTALRPTLLYYFVTLLLLATFKFTELFPSNFEGMATVTLIDTVIVIIFWINNRQEMGRLFSFKQVRVSVLLLTVAGALAGSVVVSLLADLINFSIQDDSFYDMYQFADTPAPLLFSVFFIAVMPAIFEEAAFRGFLFNNLSKITGAASAVYITAFLFGILHLAFISLIWLIPIGLIFAFLRNKYNTLWYGMAGHFTYNLAITLYEFWGWF